LISHGINGIVGLGVKDIENNIALED